MDRIEIVAKSKQYDVFLLSDLRDEISNFIKKERPDSTGVFLLTDETVAKHHLSDLLQKLESLTLPIEVFQVPSGEKAKTFSVYEECISFALEKRLDRKSILLAFGGGAVGDLGGFVAATFMRGIPFIQIPTTILAHDSAVGGKVAINHPLGKNLVGAFYHPEAVFYNLSYLQSLPKHEVRSGFAEIVKHALISDQTFLDDLITNLDSLAKLEGDLLRRYLLKGIKVKSKIVAQDERELGVRAYLNFGHTLAHAIEAESGFGKMTHGEAVMLGMNFALSISNELYDLNFPLEKFKEWQLKLGYKTKLNPNLSKKALISRMGQDKKSVGKEIRFVLLKKIGEPLLVPLEKAYLLNKLDIFD